MTQPNSTARKILGLPVWAFVLVLGLDLFAVFATVLAVRP